VVDISARRRIAADVDAQRHAVAAEVLVILAALAPAAGDVASTISALPIAFFLVARPITVAAALASARGQARDDLLRLSYRDVYGERHQDADGCEEEQLPQLSPHLHFS
jgi:hypothetical protein